MVSKRTLHPNPHLRQQRELRGWSLQEVADRLNRLCQQERKSGAANLYMVSKWERGVHTPGPFYRAKLCELFGLTTVQLGFIESGPHKGAAVAEKRADLQRQDKHFQTSIFSRPPMLPTQRDSAALASVSAQGEPMASLFEADGISESMLEMLRMLVEERDGGQNLLWLPHLQLLELGIAAFITRLAQLDRKRISAVEREELGRALSASIADSWKLFHTIGNAEVLTIGQIQLSLIHQAHPLISPFSLPYLYTGTYGLLGIALHFQERDKDALHMYHHGHMAALATGDPWYVAESLICQADSYHVLGHYGMAIQAIEEALRVIATSSDEHEKMMRARAHLLSCWADNAMMCGDDRTAQEKLEASEAYLDHIVPNEEFDRAAWLLIAGKYALHTRNYAKAKQCFEHALTELPEQWVLRHIMTAIGLAMAYAHIGEKDHSLTTAHHLVPKMKSIDAPMTNRWFTQYLQRDLLGTFPADREVQSFIAALR